MKYKYFLINKNVPFGIKESITTDNLLSRNPKFFSFNGKFSKKFEMAAEYQKLSDVMELNSLFSEEEIHKFFTKKKLVRMNKKTGEWSLPRQNEISACINKYVDIGIELFQEFLNENNEMDIDLDYLHKKCNNFLDKIESLIENEDCLIYSFSENKSYDFFIMENNCKMHIDLKKEGLLKKPKLRNNLVYECGYDNFINFLKYNLVSGNLISISLTCKAKDGIFKKIYCFSMFVNMDLEVEVVQSTSSEVFNIFTSLDNEDGKNILPEKDYLYCGDGDDIICGFDYL